MDREEIIRMAREAGFRDTTTPVVALGVSWEQVQRFAALVAAHEREACAKVLFDYAERDDLSDSDESLLKHLFELIRARGQV